MLILLQIIFIIVVLIVCFQMYHYAFMSKESERQTNCQILGIVFMVTGIMSLVSRSPYFCVFGLIMMMMGFRLIAKGLDRLNKKTFIDQCDDDK